MRACQTRVPTSEIFSIDKTGAAHSKLPAEEWGDGWEKEIPEDALYVPQLCGPSCSQSGSRLIYNGCDNCGKCKTNIFLLHLNFVKRKCKEGGLK